VLGRQRSRLPGSILQLYFYYNNAMDIKQYYTKCAINNNNLFSQGPTTPKPPCVSPVCPNITCQKNVISCIIISFFNIYFHFIIFSVT